MNFSHPTPSLILNANSVTLRCAGFQQTIFEPNWSKPPPSKTGCISTTNTTGLPLMYATLQNLQSVVNATIGQYWTIFLWLEGGGQCY